MKFTERIDQATAKIQPSKPYLLVDGRVTTYGQIRDRIARLYTVFAAKGLRAGDTLGVISETVQELAAILLAGLRCGIAVIIVNAEFSPAERRRALEAAGVAHVFIDRHLLDRGPLPPDLTHTVIDRADGVRRKGLIGQLLGTGRSDGAPDSLQTACDAATPGTPPDDVSGDSPGLLLFTSGTTSAPKVVQLSHGNLAAQIAIFDQVYDYDGDCRILNPLPLHFTDGLLHGPLATYLSGATLVRPATFSVQDLDALLHGIYRDRITHFIVVPAILALIDRLGGDFSDAFQTGDFRYVRSSGDRLPEPLWLAFQDRFGVKVVNTYGLSETVCEALFCGPDETRFRVGTIGKPVGCAVRIITERGEEAQIDEAGELVIGGDIVMLGYLNQPELTRAAINDGWLHTGDLATIDTEGFVRIVGRKKALIISAGINIQPQDIDDVLIGHDAVAEAITFGLPDPAWGEVVASAVTLTPAAGSIDEATLIGFCREHLAPQKVPRLLKIVDALPRNAAGKVLVDQLRLDFANATGRATSPEGGNLDERVLDVAARVFGCAPSELDLSAEQRNTVGWDSFAHVNLMLAVETAFGLKLSPREILSVSRLQHLRDLLALRIGSA